MKPERTLDKQIKELVDQNRKPEAVLLVIKHYKCGLKQAKDYVDKLTDFWPDAKELCSEKSTD